MGLFCPPYCRWEYEKFLSEEVNDHLKGELRKIAKERAIKLCKDYLSIIQNNELRKQTQNANDNGNGNPNGNNNPSGNDNPSGNGNPNDDPSGNGNENDSTNGNNIFDTWHTISSSCFYLTEV
ncbi:putative uncharacterized protein DDB_G0287599 [Toxotes jaculatrix]|uniref:putative uncharacterized protein DDB_G0287599 n=1 Tax=Toxotes jaculatrix TaxID=941984 RepID=UPI001B3A843B|nr:putative uncharacterized protein DDB_G0287599 [Toxotes jaculatrix]